MRCMALATLILVSTTAAVPTQDAARLDAARMRQKLVTIIERGIDAPGKRHPRSARPSLTVR